MEQIRKKIGFIGMYYLPEEFSSRHLITDIISKLRSSGNNVDVIVPNPTRGLTKEEIAKYKTMHEGGVVRLWCGKNNGDNIIGRLLRIFKFKHCLKRYLKNNKYDCLIFQSNPPIFVPLLVEKIARKRHIKTVFYIDDVFPDIMKKNNVVFKVLKKLSAKSFVNCDNVVAVSDDVKDTLILKGVDEKKIHVIYPWIFESNDSNIKRTFEFGESKFNVSYIGNIGLFQNINLILETAKKCNDSNIVFNLIGSGRNWQCVSEKIQKERINNVKIYNRVSESEAALLYKESDINLITLDKDIVKFAMPSKTGLCVLSNKPCLLICDHSKYSEKLVKDYGVYHVDSFKIEDILETINKIKNTKNLVIENKNLDFDKQTQLEKWNNIINNNLI